MSATLSLDPGRIATITLRRPERRNALDAAMLASFLSALESTAADEAARCILIQGEGEHFCAGADFGDVAAGAREGARYGAGFEALLRAIEEHPLPVVAKVRGAALGAGCQLLAACDLVVAAGDAVIGVPSARLGLLLDLEKIQRMVRVLGATTARELLLTGRSWTGTQAAARGLVTTAVPAAELDSATAALAEEIAATAPLSVRGSKAAIRAVLDHGTLDRDRDAAAFAVHDRRGITALQSADLQEGLRALRERRPPDFRGA
ncbi:MAG: enoyl-CoA hydratase/isomerase family protein [Actinomycetota bacterium]